MILLQLLNSIVVNRSKNIFLINKTNKMKLLKLSTIAIILTSFLFSSCGRMDFCVDGSGGIVTETLSISSFTGIDMAVAANVIISQGAEQEVKVTGHQNTIDRLRTDVRGDVWEIDLGKGCFNHYDLTVYITLPNLNEAHISGAGKITINDFENQGNLDISISGLGEIELNKFEGAEEITFDVSGSGEILALENIAGVKVLDIHSSGVCEFNGYPIVSDICRIDISGTGTHHVYCEDKLDINISGAAEVYYRGYPSINQKVSGIGRLIDDN